MILKLAKYDIDQIDHFLELVNDAKVSRLEYLNQLANSEKIEGLDDWLADDFVQLDDFAAITAEFAVLGLWRSVELYRKRAILKALGKSAAGNVFMNKEFKGQLHKVRIQEEKIRCARSVDELRCLNNAIKHERRVGDELSGFMRWKKGGDLGDLSLHYQRLRPLAYRYLEDLTVRLNRWWINEQKRIPSGPRIAWKSAPRVP